LLFWVVAGVKVVWLWAISPHTAAQQVAEPEPNLAAGLLKLVASGTFTLSCKSCAGPG